MIQINKFFVVSRWDYEEQTSIACIIVMQVVEEYYEDLTIIGYSKSSFLSIDFDPEVSRKILTMGLSGLWLEESEKDSSLPGIRQQQAVGKIELFSDEVIVFTAPAYTDESLEKAVKTAITNY